MKADKQNLDEVMKRVVQFVESNGETSLLLEKNAPARSSGKYSFAKSSQLSREEMAELIDLNLKLKRQA